MLLAAGCSGGGQKRPDTRFEATRDLDTLDDGPEALPRYCDILAGMRPDKLAPRDRLIRAVFYYRFHRMRALEILHSLPFEGQQRCRPLAALEERHGRDVDFLALAFAEAIQVSGGGNVDPTQVPPWVVEERERIFGDYFRSRAEFGVLDPAEYAGRAPAPLVRELERICFLELALTFQSGAWARSVEFGRAQESPRAALIGSCEALALGAARLAADPVRTAEYRETQKSEQRRYRDLSELVMAAPGPQDLPLPRLSDFGNFDFQYHYREGRQRMSMAIAEMNDGKGPRACAFLLDALQHLLFAQELAAAQILAGESPGSSEADENQRTFEDYLSAIFGTYQRLTAVEH